METQELIDRLSREVRAVRRLPAPWIRATLWFALSLLFVVAVLALKEPPGGAMARMAQHADLRLVIEQAAVLATAVAAAVAAFCSVVPGHDRRILYLPLPPLAIWLGTLGEGCLQDWLRLGWDGLDIRSDWECLPSAVLMGTVPLVAMMAMLRRGAPLAPRTSILLGALAVAALANIGLRPFHAGDASIMVLFWHVGVAAVLSLVAGATGRLVFHWRHALPRHGRA